VEATDVHGLVPSPQLEHLRHDLAGQGLRAEHLQIRPAPPGRYLCHDEALHTDVVSARRVAAIGAVVGAVLGLVAALVLPVVDGAGPVVGVVAGMAGFGALIGAMVGLQRVERDDNDPDEFHVVEPGDDLVLVSVHHEHWHNRVHHILERHGAVFLQAPTPLSASRPPGQPARR
jgi:hypothetical protein